MYPSAPPNFAIIPERKGSTSYTKARLPLRYGTHTVIRTPEYEFLFDLNGEIRFIRGLTEHWPHPHEQLKRTDGNDWVYHSVGDDSSDQGIISWMGEYYLPCLPYPSNAVWEINYFANPNIMNAFAAWSQLYGNLYMARHNRQIPLKLRDTADRIIECNDQVLVKRAKALNTIIGERISVLPPDTRHVDYDVVPLIIADGCLYRCKFCCVKSGRKFKERPMGAIREQMQQLKTFYGRNIVNYNALFLGNHDALAASDDLIIDAASEAKQALFQEKPEADPPSLFMFGSVDSLLNAEDDFFQRLSALPFHTYINIGFESLDPITLEFIGKSVDKMQVLDAFQKMLDININYEPIDVSGNFLIGNQLSNTHNDLLSQQLQKTQAPPKGKAAIYLSPLRDNPKKRELLPIFQKIKKLSQLPTYMYLIQRL